jgi:predicted transcriptional regulator of viral defense system
MIHRTPEREREMARTSALYTVERRRHATVEEVMSEQGLDAPHALFALESLRDNGILERTDAGVYLLVETDE